MIELHYAILLLIILAVFAAGYYFGVETGRMRSDTRWGYILDNVLHPMNKVASITSSHRPRSQGVSGRSPEKIVLYLGEALGLQALAAHPSTENKIIVHVTEPKGLVQSAPTKNIEVVVESLTQLNSNKKLRELYEVAVEIYPEDSINQLSDL